MGERTGIVWTDYTFNPVMGCRRVSEGCRSCYAERLTRTRMGLSLWGDARQVTSPGNWRKVLRWNREAAAGGPRLVFCASLCDVFEDHATIDAMRPRLWDLVRETPALTWQILTKRPERIASCLPADWGVGYANVWLGTSIESADYAGRADHLRRIPAAVRFISYEPAIGPLAGALDLGGIDWLIAGGESGPGHRPMDARWAREMRDACWAAGVAFFFKQSSGPRPGTGTLLDGETVREWPGAWSREGIEEAAR